MFQSLRQNSQVYIFHKGNNPSLEIGTVTNIPVAKPKYGLPSSFGQVQELVVDLVVKTANQTLNYNGLPANLEIADSFSNGENVVVSDNRDAMNAEILNYKQKSVDAINSIDSHKNIVNSCEEILNSLNPEYAEKKQQQNEIAILKSQMEGMSNTLTTLTGLVESLTRQNNEQNVGNTGK